MYSQEERPYGVHDVGGGSQTRTMTFVHWRHDCHIPGAQCSQRYPGGGMIKEWLVERRGYDYWRAAGNRLSHDRQDKVICDAAGALVEGIKTAWREQYDTAWRHWANVRVEVALDDPHALYI